ncbi:deoxyribonuclease-2-alpha [Galendromus occidentalis]|uniref:Deoxyribonuclease-2-alpha n=1 Tax=Galendromus occidentalis TaxID=34638 RepID=A0AAJ6QRL7_9ACAR|nr:deoxyribonuclease-2-alpha [Galendromus occidentalis]
MKILSFVSVLICIGRSPSEALWCKDAEGNQVEWSLIYKLPHRLSQPPSSPLSSVPKRSKHDGSDYGYIDSRMVADGARNFSSGAKGIFSDEQNPLANSLEPLFKWSKAKANRELVYIAYNDQPPVEGEKASWSSGHTKGVVLFDSDSGLWLVHSVPKFPENTFSGNFSFPKNGYVNGQTLLCMSFKSRQLNSIAAHLLNQEAHIYESHAPANFSKLYPNLSLLLSNPSAYNVTQNVTKNVIRGVRGMPFLAFAKSGSLDDDVYSRAIAPALGSDLYVSSWQNGEGGKLDSECSMKFKVLDVESVSFTFGESETAWSTKNDHSKWAVTRSKSTWLCIGSINRMRSQFKRGGETVCLSERTLGKLFQNAVTNHTTCDSDKAVSSREP